MHNEGLYILSYLPSIPLMITSRNIDEECGTRELHTEFWWRKLRKDNIQIDLKKEGGWRWTNIILSGYRKVAGCSVSSETKLQVP